MALPKLPPLNQQLKDARAKAEEEAKALKAQPRAQYPTLQPVQRPAEQPVAAMAPAAAQTRPVQNGTAGYDLRNYQMAMQQLQEAQNRGAVAYDRPSGAARIVGPQGYAPIMRASAAQASRAAADVAQGRANQTDLEADMARRKRLTAGYR